jgi:hypothetical protein
MIRIGRNESAGSAAVRRWPAAVPIRASSLLALEEGAGRVVGKVEGSDPLEAAFFVVPVQADVVGPDVDPDPVVAEVSGTLACPVDDVDHPLLEGADLCGREPGEDAPEVPLPHARLHDLRHIHATLFLVAEVPVHVVADRLGHADPSVTLRVYAHVIRRHPAGIADVFAAAADEIDDDEEGPEEAAGVPY